MTERLDFRLLGPLEVARGDELIDLGGYKQGSLVALFLIHVNRVVSTDRIIDALWGEEAGDKENALWVYFSRLRSVLEPERTGRGEHSVLVTKDPGYALEVDPAQVDFLCFELGLDQARVQIETDPQGTVETLDEALGLWRGNPLDDLAYEEFTRNEVGRLSELRLEANELRVDARLALGQTGELVSGLQAIARENPYRERPVGQLMIALYRSGRQAEALRAYEHHRRILSDELGIDPSPELRQLEEQILLHDERLVARRQAPLHAVTDRAVPTPYRGLHAFRESDESSFFGRESLGLAGLMQVLLTRLLSHLTGETGLARASR